MLATHVGSLPRPRDLLATLLEKEEGGAVDEEALGARVRDAVADVVRRQVAYVGLDVIDDGEMSKPSFITYVTERLSGFEPQLGAGAEPWAGSRGARRSRSSTRRRESRAAAPRFVCTGPITYVGHARCRPTSTI